MTLSRQETGVSLIEVIIFIVVVTIAVLGILQVFALNTQQSADPMMRKQALAIAEAMLEEVEFRDFDNPTGGFAGPYTVANRASFDDVLDYNNFSMTGIMALDGTPVAGLANYRVTVAVVNAPLGSIAAAGESRLITVTVTDPRNNVLSLSGYRANY